MLAKEAPPEHPANERADDAKQNRRAHTHRVGSGDEQPSNEPGNDSNDQEVKQECDHKTLLAFRGPKVSSGNCAVPLRGRLLQLEPSRPPLLWPRPRAARRPF